MVELLLQIKPSAPHSPIPSGSQGTPPDLLVSASGNDDLSGART